MKKFTKVAAILAASAILFGGMFMSCSDSDDSNDGTPSTPVSDKAPAPAVTFTSATKTVAKTDLGEATAASVVSSDATIATATVSEGAVIIVSVKAGSATITATAEGYSDASIPVTVAANGTITLGTITKFAVKSSESVGVNYTADFKALTNGTAVLADTYVAGNTGTGSPSVDLSAFPTDNVPLIIDASAKNGMRLRKDTNNINYNGGTTAAFGKTAVGETLSETLDRYVALDVSKLATSGNVTVTFAGITKMSKKGTAYLGQVVLIDQSNKILASATNLKIDETGSAEGVDEFSLSATIDASAVTKVTLGFSRGGVGGGGIDVTGITAKTAE